MPTVMWKPGEPREPLQRTTAGGGMVLGPGEVEIAELVASGFTDARIVARLRLSKRTFDARLE